MEVIRMDRFDKIMVLIPVLFVISAGLGVTFGLIGYFRSVEEREPYCLRYFDKEYCDESEIECAMDCEELGKDYLRLD